MAKMTDGLKGMANVGISQTMAAYNFYVNECKMAPENAIQFAAATATYVVHTAVDNQYGGMSGAQFTHALSVQDKGSGITS